MVCHNKETNKKYLLAPLLNICIGIVVIAIRMIMLS